MHDDSHESPHASVQDLVVPAVLLRAARTPWSELVHVYVAHGPTVAFTSRDLRSPGIGRAVTIARHLGFEAVVRSPGGRMVAYDSGAVVIDHLTRTSGLRGAGKDVFARNAASHAEVLHGIGGLDARVGEVEGEYCPGRYSVNVAGQVKIIGSAQRVVSTGTLFSTVVQVAVSDRVRAVIVAVSEALGYPLRVGTIGGLTDHVPTLTSSGVAAAFAADYRERLAMTDGEIPSAALTHAATAAGAGDGPPFHVEAWTRAHPLSETYG
ncbi:lipoate--protein ligase family protein [Aeromicrobium sp. NPDC092404]|uniref:lipoate--protein ligase family protein n=1 Tax=Aeromicrobium sp. NPDC092404 TaxID=3154976 RepID=UPI00342BADCF